MLPRLLDVITQLRPAQNDAQLLPPWIAILSRAYDVSSQVDPDDTFFNLPTVFEMVSQFLQSPSENIRISASECLVSFLVNCVPPRLLDDLSIYDEKVIQKMAAISENLLTVAYQMAWQQTFSVLCAMFDALRWRAYPFLLEVVKTMGEMRGNDAFSGKKEADEVIGKAIRAMGPEAVSRCAPSEPRQTLQWAARSSLAPPAAQGLCVQHKSGTFQVRFCTLSEALFQRTLEHGSAEKTMEIKIYETVVQQIWSITAGILRSTP